MTTRSVIAATLFASTIAQSAAALGDTWAKTNDVGNLSPSTEVKVSVRSSDAAENHSDARLRLLLLLQLIQAARR